ncbi:peptidase inhibitor family I36 protein [Streptomyces sp. NPDC001939]
MTAAAALAAVLLTPVPAGAAVPPTSGDCAAGELCLWEKPEFKGHRQAYELSGASGPAATPPSATPNSPMRSGTSCG